MPILKKKHRKSRKIHGNAAAASVEVNVKLLKELGITHVCLGSIQNAQSKL